jgi:DNA-binding beta-propeller fold protein YncE
MGSGDGQFRHPASIAIDLQGNVYVADSDNNRIQVFRQTPVS